MIERFQALALLRRHVVRRAEQRARLGAAAADCDGRRISLAMPKSSTFTKSAMPRRLHEEDVLGLQVAVNDRLLVRRAERRRDLARRCAAPRRPAGAARARAARRGLALEQLHHDVVARLDLAEVRDLDDVRVADAVHQARFVAKRSTISALPDSSSRIDLDGGSPPHHGVLGEVDFAHRTRPRAR